MTWSEWLWIVFVAASLAYIFWPLFRQRLRGRSLLHPLNQAGWLEGKKLEQSPYKCAWCQDKKRITCNNKYEAPCPFCSR